MNKLALSIACNLIFILSAAAETSVWEARSKEHTIYLGGTCHVLRKSDYPLPVEFEQAYNDSDLVIFETDIGQLDNPEVLQSMMDKSVYNDGSRLDTVLSQETYDLLKQHCEDIGFPVSALHLFRPSMAMLQLFTFELGRLGITQDGVDSYFYGKAQRENKPIGMLETIEEQINYVLSMGVDNENEFVHHTIKDMKQAEKTIDELITAWREGDEQKLKEILVTKMKRDYPKIYDRLLIQRNAKWLPKIEHYLNTPEREFVLIGAGHLVGEDSIIHHLTRRGYVVNRVH